MCLKCEGWSDDEIADLLADRVERNGFTTFAVMGKGTGPTWTYTIGLAAVGHPELVVMTMAPDLAEELLSTLAQGVLDGDRLDAVDTVHIGLGLVAQVRDVHPAHVEHGLVEFAVIAHRATKSAETPELRALQIVVPDDAFCPCHAGAQPRLHLAHVTFGATRTPKRAERRRTARRRWHSRNARG